LQPTGGAAFDVRIVALRVSTVVPVVWFRLCRFLDINGLRGWFVCDYPSGIIKGVIGVVGVIVVRSRVVSTVAEIKTAMPAVISTAVSATAVSTTAVATATMSTAGITGRNSE